MPDGMWLGATIATLCRHRRTGYITAWYNMASPGDTIPYPNPMAALIAHVGGDGYGSCTRAAPVRGITPQLASAYRRGSRAISSRVLPAIVGRVLPPVRLMLAVDGWSVE